MCSRRTRAWWVGLGIISGSAEVQGSANGYFYSMQAFALAVLCITLCLEAHDDSTRS